MILRCGLCKEDNRETELRVLLTRVVTEHVYWACPVCDPHLQHQMRKA